MKLKSNRRKSASTCVEGSKEGSVEPKCEPDSPTLSGTPHQLIATSNHLNTSVHQLNIFNNTSATSILSNNKAFFSGVEEERQNCENLKEVINYHKKDSSKNKKNIQSSNLAKITNLANFEFGKFADFREANFNAYNNTPFYPSESFYTRFPFRHNFYQQQHQFFKSFGQDAFKKDWVVNYIFKYDDNLAACFRANQSAWCNLKNLFLQFKHSFEKMM